jgi:hypothetical protein
VKLLSIFFKIVPLFFGVIFASQTFSSGFRGSDIYITSANLPSEMSQDFSLKKISSDRDLNLLPEEFQKLVMTSNEFDYYYAISPTKRSGGYHFEIDKTTKENKACLRAPSPMSAVTTALTTPIALIKVRKGVKFNTLLAECP